MDSSDVSLRTNDRPASARAPEADAAKPPTLLAVLASLSLLRLALAALFPLVGRIEGLVLVLLAGASDGLDGFLARRWRLTTAWGSVLDGVGDKVFLWTALVTLVVRGELSVWIVLPLLGRDIVVVPTAFVIVTSGRWRLFRHFDHHILGRLATVAIFVALVAELAVPQGSVVNNVILASAAALSVAAGVAYLIRIRGFIGANVNQESDSKPERS